MNQGSSAKLLLFSCNTKAWSKWLVFRMDALNDFP